MVKSADDKTIPMLSDNTALKSLNHNSSKIWNMNDAVFAIEDAYIISYDCISVLIPVHQRLQRAPCSQIAPAEIRRNRIYAVGLFRYSIVDRNLLACREKTANCI